jgi:MSHA biogenesis protein MshJ
MTAATYVGHIASRVNEMSLRERALVFAAALGVVALLWDQALMQPLARRELAAQSVLTSLAQPADPAASSGTSALDIVSARLSDAVQREQTVRLRLNSVNAELGATAADLLPPEKVVQVVRDVLAGQRGLELLSLRNMAPLPLVPPDNPDSPPLGPFLHPVEVTVAGDYLSVLEYLQGLERLPWRFYWRTLDLKVDKYPRNIVRLEIATLGTDEEWLGVGKPERPVAAAGNPPGAGAP